MSLRPVSLQVSFFVAGALFLTDLPSASAGITGDSAEGEVPVNYTSISYTATLSPLESGDLPEYTNCGSGVHVDEVTVTAWAGEHGGDQIIVKVEDPNPTNEYITWFRVWRDGSYITAYEYDLNASIDYVKLTMDSPLLIGEEIEVDVREYRVGTALLGCHNFYEHSDASPVWVSAPEDNMLLLQDSTRDPDDGCHNQGIKFTGHRFFSSCADYDGDNEALAFVHSRSGVRSHLLSLGTDYQHPSGLARYGYGQSATIYLGFSDTGSDVSQPLRYWYDESEGAYSDQLNNNNDVQRDAGYAVLVPADRCDIDTSWGSNVRFYDGDSQYRFDCARDGNSACGSVTSLDGPNSPENGPQDCALYWKDGWMRACILLSDNDNEVAVFRADATSVDETYWVDGSIFLTGSLPYSGGFEIWDRDQDWSTTNDRYILLSVDGDGGCGLLAPCTDEDGHQPIQFLTWDSLKDEWEGNDWPDGDCSG